MYACATNSFESVALMWLVKLIGMIYLKVTGFFGFMITKRFKHPETFVFTKLWNRTKNVSLQSRSGPWWNREVETFGGVADRGSHSHLGGQARLSGHFTTLRSRSESKRFAFYSCRPWGMTSHMGRAKNFQLTQLDEQTHCQYESLICLVDYGLYRTSPRKAPG